MSTDIPFAPITSDGDSCRPTLIRDLNDDERPREKALKHGIKSLTDVELMAIIFATGLRGKSVIELSREILADNKNHLSDVARMTPHQMMKKYKGIGAAKAITLLGALELGARSHRDALTNQRTKVTSSEIADSVMRPHFMHLNHEEFWVLLMSAAGTVKAEVRIGIGGSTATYVDVKVIMKAAIEHQAASMILCHNHPSGNLTPSSQDDSLTKKIKTAAEYIDVRVNDHLIFTDSSYYSYADHGRM
jgi:DNA repair protein RadC